MGLETVTTSSALTKTTHDKNQNRKTSGDTYSSKNLNPSQGNKNNESSQNSIEQ
jgi:hypothetical protein